MVNAQIILQRSCKHPTRLTWIYCLLARNVELQFNMQKVNVVVRRCSFSPRMHAVDENRINVCAQFALKASLTSCRDVQQYDETTLKHVNQLSFFCAVLFITNHYFVMFSKPITAIIRSTMLSLRKLLIYNEIEYFGADFFLLSAIISICAPIR